MKTKTQEKKTDLRALGFTEITNLIVIKGGNGDGDIEKSDIKKEKEEKGDQEPG